MAPYPKTQKRLVRLVGNFKIDSGYELSTCTARTSAPTDDDCHGHQQRRQHGAGKITLGLVRRQEFDKIRDRQEDSNNDDDA